MSRPDDSAPHAPVPLERRRLRVQGIVQGVGFRPFVYGQATRAGLSGFVRNDAGGVTIEVEGPAQALLALERALRDAPPPLARVDHVMATAVPLRGERSFSITPSETTTARRTLVSPDVATCDDCLRELFDPDDRRYRYPFINCTNCGPRFTIIQDLPYDRTHTTMRLFPMCADCRAEYDDPLDRRFHAQPNACPACGPRLCLLDERGAWAGGDDPLGAAARRLAEGAILAVKGIGGYHLACDALNNAAVMRLRHRKRREAKPFALMVPDLETARRLCVINAAEAALLGSHARPIVLLRRRATRAVARDVAPGYDTLGLMLPYTPLHSLLLGDFARAVGPERPAALVMTSGNLSDEPIAYGDDDAMHRLAPVADGWLLHDRDIHARCDDSVGRVVAPGVQWLRRSRGYVPEPVPLAHPLPVPVLACGGHLKNTFCLGKGTQAFVSPHIGDLENLETLIAFRDSIAHFQHLFDIQPEAVAYDLHPDYLATRHALDVDATHHIGVQHHHAHVASVMAEHGLDGPVIGLAADGTGFGPDGAVWGGEVLVCELATFERVAHLAYVPLPGGDQAIRQPWRMAAVLLQHTFGDTFLELDLPVVQRLAHRPWPALARMIERGVNSPLTSSLGRLFDGVAALLGVRDVVQYEAQAAIELEMVAAPIGAGYPFAIHEHEDGPAEMDIRPMIRALVEAIRRGDPLPEMAGRVHRTVAEMLLAACELARHRHGPSTVALSGGLFQNRLLLEQVLELLSAAGFESYINRRVPPNDGGLSLGQAAVAGARLEQRLTHALEEARPLPVSAP